MSGFKLPFSGILYRKQERKLPEDLFDLPEIAERSSGAPRRIGNEAAASFPLLLRNREVTEQETRQQNAADPSIGAIADCARKQLRLMRKNNELLKNSSGIRYYE